MEMKHFHVGGFVSPIFVKMEIKHFHVRIFDALVIALGTIFQTSEAVVAKLITVNNLFRAFNKFESIIALITTALSRNG